jgi:hypothetical protein
MPASSVILVELGFQRNALLSVDLFADRHGVKEDLRHRGWLLVPVLGVVVVLQSVVGWR